MKNDLLLNLCTMTLFLILGCNQKGNLEKKVINGKSTQVNEGDRPNDSTGDQPGSDQGSNGANLGDDHSEEIQDNPHNDQNIPDDTIPTPVTDGEENNLPHPHPTPSSNCAEPQTGSNLPPLIETENPVQNKMSFNELAHEINAACSNCHLAPASKTAGFWYLSSYDSAEIRANGEKVNVAGISDAADTIRRVLSSERMPPAVMRNAAPEKYKSLQTHLEDWIRAGKPRDNFAVGTSGSSTSGEINRSDTGLEHCTPTKHQVGVDVKMDNFFLNATKLPEKISETDLTTTDSLELARRGTLAYDVEYPLWADNAEKGRYVHFPAIWDETSQNWKLSSARFDPGASRFDIPPNTRFYKTFYKSITTASGEQRFRKIETRITVVRKLPQESLLGTYRWNANETEASLVSEPYRDGTPFKDQIFEIITNEVTQKSRKYAIPGKQRCVECHKGGEDYVLGFSPIQLNRRSLGEAGRDREVSSEELNQVQRLIEYGVLSNISSASELPKLESAGTRTPRNIHETRLQGYFVGNCAHCHNPNGFAMKENNVTLDLREGQIFDFDLRRITRDSNRTSPKYFIKAGDLTQSQIYQRIYASKIGEGGRFLPMPMHTPGDANCKLLNLTAKWIYSLSSDPAIAAKASEEPISCQVNDDFPWLDLDMTWPTSSTFVPRRADWKDPAGGMPSKFFSLNQDRRLSNLVMKQVPVDFWDRVPNANGQSAPKCDFPQKQPPRKPVAWMLNAEGNMKFPAGELYMATPGAHFYNTTCAKCHGSVADGKSGLASNLLTLTGGSIRVANLRDGLLAPASSPQFDVTASFGRKRNLTGNYLIWMAMEGTRVNFPAEMEPYVGRHKAQMLNQLRDRCKNFIETSPQRATSRMKDYLAFKDVCFFKNGNPNDPEIQFDPSTDQPLNPEALEEWADKAAINIGWAIFDYLKNEGMAGKWQPAKNECDKIYPKATPLR